MKVRIGSYRSHWTSQIHYDYMNKKYSYKWEDSHTTFERVLEKLESVVQTIYNCTINLVYKNLEGQSIKVRIDGWDTWSMDHTLSHIIVPMLKQLKETKHGGPHVEDEDVPENLRSTSAGPKESDYDTDEFWFDRWDWVLNEMIWAFEQKTRDDWMGDYYGEWITDNTKVLGGNFASADHDGIKAHQDRMTNGFRLFGKYYEALWD